MPASYNCEVLLSDVQCKLGESPFWHNDTLYWVDIHGKELHHYCPKTKKHVQCPTETQLGCIVPCTVPGRLATATDDYFGLVDPTTGQVEKITPNSGEIEAVEESRFNDGKCDPAGRFLAGTMGTAKPRVSGLGRLYSLTCVDGSSSSSSEGKDVEAGVVEAKQFGVTKLLSNLTVSNGLCWNEKGDTLYYIDTYDYKVMQYGYNLGSGEIDVENGKCCVDFTKHDECKGAGPDGMTIDKDGMLWVAMFRGSKVTRWDPQTGELIGIVEVPVPHVTSVCFGDLPITPVEGDSGADAALSTLFITTAKGSHQAEIDANTAPNAGCIFVAKVPTSGFPVDVMKI
eukprot:TRINITY_DN67363_c0_g1_i2.p1 TRINITY_DN67363_c0_g1~~TRINITY_DN67363_c0_g1_i2.p1  ORF type:complete len:342 (-),score=36.85 TRINITY_DN67363_c0_g1_i2:983-2008(-)